MEKNRWVFLRQSENQFCASPASRKWADAYRAITIPLIPRPPLLWDLETCTIRRAGELPHKLFEADSGYTGSFSIR